MMKGISLFEYYWSCVLLTWTVRAESVISITIVSSNRCLQFIEVWNISS
uniref:Uncharacterized protein n=1 Tax=Anguilla anguilla TaxID=7936 RepID=A0A0E9WQ60_ANGAN